MLLKPRFFITAVIALTLLAACGGRPDFKDRITGYSDSYTGILEPLPSIDIYQGGTHQIHTDADELIFIQSPEINLNRYLEKRVTVYGEMAEPVGNARPVFNVFELKLDLESAAGEVKDYENKSDGFTLSYPDAWELVDGQNQIAFLSGGKEIVKISVTGTEASLEGFVAGKEKEEGTPVTVGTQKALRYTDETSARFYIPNPSKKKIYSIAYFVSKEAGETELFFDLIKSFNQIYTPVRTGRRCGGPAKLKCGENFRCELFSTGKDAAGICVSLSETGEDTTCPFIPVPGDCEEYEAVSFSVSGCPTRYTCAGEEENAPAKEPVNISRVMNTLVKYKARILESRAAEIVRFEISAKESLIAVVYKKDEKTEKILFTYEPSGNEFSFTERARFQGGDADSFTLISGHNLQADLEKQVIYTGEQ